MRPIEDEQIEIIRCLYPTKSVGEVAERARCSRKTVLRYARRMGLARPPRRAVTRDERLLASFRRLVEGGMSCAKAARSLGYSGETGAYWARAMGIERQKRTLITGEMVREMVRLAPAMTYGEIARRLGVGHNTVARRVGQASPETAREHGEYARRWVSEHMRSLVAEHKAETAARRAEIVRRDRWRWLNGLPQQTRFHFSCQSALKIGNRYRLRQKGYVEDDNDHSLFYITPGTRRSEQMERNARQKHKIRFKDARETEFSDSRCRAGAGQQDTEKIGDDGR